MNTNELVNFNYRAEMQTGAANYTIGSSAGDSMNEKVCTDICISNQCEIQNEQGRYSIYDIANWFLLKTDMTHKKLQKLCYYAQAWCYAINDYRLIDTDFQAWVHGPVSPALWEKFKGFGYDTIRYCGDGDKISIKPEDVSLLERVWETYGDRTGNALEALSHKETPWIETRKGYAEDEKCTKVISPELMRDYYRSIYVGA